MKAWLDGKIVDEQDTHVSLLAHSFSRGSAIFEVVDIVSTQQGPALFGLSEHIDRFFNTAKYTYLDVPLNKEQLIQAVVETAKVNSVQSGAAKFFAYFPDIELKVVPATPNVSVAIFAVDFEEFGMDRAAFSVPMTVGISKHRKNHPESVPPHAKITGNYVNSYLSVMEVKKRGYQEALLLDTMGFVAEGPSSNAFFIKNHKILTPHLRAVLPGITRSAVIQVLREMNYVVEETDIRPDDIIDCDEAFFTSSLAGVHPVRSLEGRKIGENCPGPITTVLINKMKEIMDGNLTGFQKWLTPIR